MNPLSTFMTLLLFGLAAMFTQCPADADTCPRRAICLDGIWDIAEGGMELVPEVFAYRVPVPGLVDMSSPDFFEVGIPSARRQAFWYHRAFRLEGEVPASAVLKIHKAMFGTRVYLNGKQVGEHWPCFTPALFDVHEFLKGNGEKNELVIRVGAHKDVLPKTMPNGWDFEKYKYIPGIYDSVELILSGTPRLVNAQVAPDVPGSAARVQAEVENTGQPRDFRLAYVLREAQSGTVVVSGETDPLSIVANETKTIDFRIPVSNARLWSPEDPFLYELELSTGADTLKTRFGMRSFSFDVNTGRAVLNGKPYFMRGTNVCIYRFFEDAARGGLPWNQEWALKLHEKFKGMHWNSIRYCIGFPPEFWYDIADELGILIQDEFPIWFLGEYPPELKSDAIAAEYREWMRERWNHPCVVIWDAQNETVTEETGKAIAAVRELDLSNRPWDNGWAVPQGPNDPVEAHPYFFSRDLFQNQPFHMAELAQHDGRPPVREEQKPFNRPVIINEYAWLWLNRDGSETTLTKKAYENLLGPDSTVEQRRDLYARYLAAKTEFWRAHRHCAAVMHFCGLGYSRPGGIERPVAGATSDHFIDLNHLIFEPRFESLVRDAFSPVGLMIDLWEEQFAPGTERTISVYVIDDLYESWKGLARLRLERDGEPLWEKSAAAAVEPLGQTIVSFDTVLPAEAGKYEMVAELIRGEDQPVRSRRVFEIVK